MSQRRTLARQIAISFDICVDGHCFMLGGVHFIDWLRLQGTQAFKYNAETGVCLKLYKILFSGWYQL